MGIVNNKARSLGAGVLGGGLIGAVCTAVLPMGMRAGKAAAVAGLILGLFAAIGADYFIDKAWKGKAGFPEVGLLGISAVLLLAGLVWPGEIKAFFLGMAGGVCIFASSGLVFPPTGRIWTFIGGIGGFVAVILILYLLTLATPANLM